MLNPFDPSQRHDLEFDGTVITRYFGEGGDPVIRCGGSCEEWERVEKRKDRNSATGVYTLIGKDV